MLIGALNGCYMDYRHSRSNIAESGRIKSTSYPPEKKGSARGYHCYNAELPVNRKTKRAARIPAWTVPGGRNGRTKTDLIFHLYNFFNDE